MFDPSDLEAQAAGRCEGSESSRAAALLPLAGHVVLSQPVSG